MYAVIVEELLESGLVLNLTKFVWMGAEDNHVVEDDTYRCKANTDSTRPEMCDVADEVGGNISQKDNGKIGGE